MESEYNPVSDPMNGPNRFQLERPRTPLPEISDNLDSDQEPDTSDKVKDVGPLGRLGSVGYFKVIPDRK